MNDQEMTRALQIPGGEITQKADGAVAVYLNNNRSNVDQMTSRLRAVGHLDSRYFFLPQIEKTENDNHKLCLIYPSVDQKAYRFADIIQQWRKESQIRMPTYLSLVNFLVESHRYRHDPNCPLLTPSPITLFFTPELPGNWRLLPVPLVNNSLGDWAAADPETWQWVSSSNLLFQDSMCKKLHSLLCESYLIGSTLYYCLVGELFPAQLTRREKFQRLLTARKGNYGATSRAVTSRAIRSALPSSLAEEGDQLAEMLLNLMVPENKVQTDVEQSHKHIQGIVKEFSAHRLAVRWEYEGRFRIAVDLLSVYEELVPPEAIPWETVARLNEKLQDQQGALEARLKALEFSQIDAIRNAVNHLQHIVKFRLDPSSHPDVDKLLAQIEIGLTQTKPGLYDLQVAHLELRYLNMPEKAHQRTSLTYQDAWHRLLQIVLRVRVSCMQNHYASTSKLCEQGLQILAHMSEQQGGSSQCIQSFFLTVDGIAHFGATGQLDELSYLIDAFSRFTRSLDVALEVQARDLIYTNLHWILLLREYAVHFPSEIQRTLTTGINAYLQLKQLAGVEIPDTIIGIPSIPWYCETLFFPHK